MVLAEARIYTSTPVQSAFHYLNGALHSAGFGEAELKRSKRGEEVSLVVWRPNTFADSVPQHDLDADGFYACGIQGIFTRQEKKKKISLAWELKLDYEPPRERADNTNRLYHVDLQCLLREDNKRRPTENISFHYNKDAQPAKWDVVRNWIRFVLDLRALNPPAWATLKSRLDVSEVVIDSINRRSMDWSSPPTSPVKQTAAPERGLEEQLKPFVRYVWKEWALPNLTRHDLCDVTRRITSLTKDKGRGYDTAATEFTGCDGNVDWEVVGQRHDGLRASLDGYRSPRMSGDTRSSSRSSTGMSSETRTLREGQGLYRLGDVDEDIYEDEDVRWE